MAKVILGMTMSLDGFSNDRSGSVSALYPDLAALRDTEPLRESIQNTGAVVMGRNSFAMADDPDSIAGNYEYQVPIFVLTHEAPKKKPKETDRLTFTCVRDGIESALAQAKGAGQSFRSPKAKGEFPKCLSRAHQHSTERRERLPPEGPPAREGMPGSR